MTDLPFIKKFEIDGNYYIYDVNTNKFLNVDEPVYLLIDGEEDGIDSNLLDKYPRERIEETKNNINKMKAAGLFSGKRPQITFFHSRSKTQFKEDIRKSVGKKLARIILNVTEKCNLRCKYCTYSEHYVYHRSHSEEVMSIETMKKAVDFYFSNSTQNDEKLISFYGGEPLIAFNLIRQCVDYVKRNYSSRVKYNMTTNATLLSRPITKFLVENDFSLLISIDGPKNLHDRYRVYKNNKGTFYRVTTNLNRIKADYPDYYHNRLNYNMVIAPPVDFNSLNDFLDQDVINSQWTSFNSVNYFFTTFFDCISKQTMKLTRDLFEESMASYNRKMAAGEEPTIVEKKLFEMMYFEIHRRDNRILPDKCPSHGQCMIGTKGIFVSSDGTYNYCPQVDKGFNIGNVNEGVNFQAIEKTYFELDEFYARHCYDCWAIRLCKKCMRDFTKNGKIDEDAFLEMCKQTRGIIYRKLKDYISIRSLNPNAFDYLEEVEIH